MKNLFVKVFSLVLLFSLQLNAQFSGGDCGPSIDPLVSSGGELCASGPGLTYSQPTSSLPDVEYFILVNGTLDQITADPTVDPTALSLGDEVCVTAVGYDQQGVNDLLTAFQPLCGFAEGAGLVPEGTCVVIDDLIANGGIQELGDVVAVSEAFGATINSVADLAASVDAINAQVGGFGLPMICYASSPDDCSTIVCCSDVIAPNIDNLCGGGDIEICIELNTDNDGFTLAITGDFSANETGSGGSTQLCTTIAIANNDGCDPIDYNISYEVLCADGSDPTDTAYDGHTNQGPNAGEFNTFTVTPNLTEVITYPDCEGNPGSAILLAGDGVTECQNIPGVIGVANVCPDMEFTDASLSYDFSGFSSDCYSGTSDDFAMACEEICEMPPNFTGFSYSSADVCHNDVLTICVQFDGPADDILVNGNGPANGGDTEVCYDVTTTAVGCDPTDNTDAPVVDWTFYGGLIIDVGEASWTTNPTFTEVIVMPDCNGNGGSATLTAGDGTVCQEIFGIGGVLNDCPSTDATNAELTYDFTTFNNVCTTTLTADSQIINCEVVCAECPNYVETTNDAENGICHDGVVTVCVVFDGAADGVVVNGVGVANAGDESICYEVVAAADGCNVTNEVSSPDVICNLYGTPIDVNDTSWDTNPVFTEEIVLPDCNGNEGYALVMAGDGTICEEVFGDAGASNICPDTNDTDAFLSYDFTGYDNACSQMTAGVELIDCQVGCAECPNYLETTVSTENACHGEMVTVCINFDGPADGISVNGNGVANAGDNSICYEVAATTQGCESSAQSSSSEVICNVDNTTLTGIADASWTTLPSFTEVITLPDCNGNGGSAVLMAGDGTVCSTIEGTSGMSNVCPELNATSGTLTYDFSSFNNACYTGTAVTESVNCFVPCGDTECPNVVDQTISATEVCAGDTLAICITFDGPADAVTVNGGGVATAGDTQICLNIVASVAGCSSAESSVSLNVVCAIDGTSYDGEFDFTFNVAPTFTEVIVAPDCDGNGGSAMLVAGDGTVCETVTGTGGQANVCPDENFVNGSLVYDFSAYNNGCFTAVAGSETSECEENCTNCPDTPDTFNVDYNLCEGEVATINGEDFSEVGSYTQSIINAEGCEEIYEITVERLYNCYTCIFDEDLTDINIEVARIDTDNYDLNILDGSIILTTLSLDKNQMENFMALYVIDYENHLKLGQAQQSLLYKENDKIVEAINNIPLVRSQNFDAAKLLSDKKNVDLKKVDYYINDFVETIETLNIGSSFRAQMR